MQKGMTVALALTCPEVSMVQGIFVSGSGLQGEIDTIFGSNECSCLVQLLWSEREVNKKMMVFRQSRLQSVS